MDNQVRHILGIPACADPKVYDKGTYGHVVLGAFQHLVSLIRPTLAANRITHSVNAGVIEGLYGIQTRQTLAVVGRQLCCGILRESEALEHRFERINSGHFGWIVVVMRQLAKGQSILGATLSLCGTKLGN